MGTREQMEATYNYMDEYFRLSLGECGDFDAAYYNGDYSKTLDQAQEDKHEFVFQMLNFAPGKRILDIGSGWGPFLKAAKERDGHAVGLTLSTKQAESCIRGGYEVYLKDWKDVTVDTFGKFDGVACVGALEHFCSKEEFDTGEQEGIYEHFFRLCHELLDDGGRLYLQTGVWGKNAPNFEDILKKSKKGSNEYVVAQLLKFYEGTWLPLSKDQLVRLASPYFRLISSSNGRLDYIETLNQFGKRNSALSLAKIIALIKMMRYFFIDPNFRLKLRCLMGGFTKVGLRRELFDFERMVFERT